jgi:hypothetical protein
MFGFLLKKTFFDMWDNLFRIIIFNLGFLAISAIFFLLVPLVLPIPALAIGLLLIGIAMLAVFCGAVSKMVSAVADYKQPGFAEFWSSVKETYPTSLLLALAVSVYATVVSIAFRFYQNLPSLAGPLAVSLLFWVTVVVVLSAQYSLPIVSRLNEKLLKVHPLLWIIFPVAAFLSIRKIIRKSFLVLLDNPGFSIGIFLFSLIILAISTFTAFLLPGISTIFLLWNAAFKLRLYKYDYLEQNPTANRKRIPWDALLIEDRERVGKRTLKGMIFPWKE